MYPEAPVNLWLRNSTLFFCMLSIVFQTTLLLHHCNFWLEVFMWKFCDDPIKLDEFTSNQIRTLIEDKLWVVAGSKESIQDIRLGHCPWDICAQILKLILLSTCCFKAVTLQWKITNLNIFVFAFGILLLLELSKYNSVRKFYERRIVRAYNDSLAKQTWLDWIQIYCNHQLQWVTSIVHFVTFLLASACLFNYFRYSWDEMVFN